MNHYGVYHATFKCEVSFSKLIFVQKILRGTSSDCTALYINNAYDLKFYIQQYLANALKVYEHNKSYSC